MVEKASQKFEIQKIYIKDISFEAPNSPKIFTQKWNPKIDVRIHAENTQLDEHVFEVCITVTVTASQKETTAFLVEVKQAGIFTIRNFKEERNSQLLGSHCPNILFPFVRESVAELIAKSGFPQLLLNPVDFEALYQQHLQALQEQSADSNPVKH